MRVPLNIGPDPALHSNLHFFRTRRNILYIEFRSNRKSCAFFYVDYVFYVVCDFQQNIWAA